MTPTLKPTAIPTPRDLPRVGGFRKRVLVTIMLVVSAVTLLALYLAERNLNETIERELHREFASGLQALHQAQAVRHAVLVERCRALVRKPRIHAALEDDALDLLYLSAEDELRDALVARAPESRASEAVLTAHFYRFLDREGRVIAAPAEALVGPLPHALESQLALPGLDATQHVGYLAAGGAGDPLWEVIATPIVSSESGEPIAALVLGFTRRAVSQSGDVLSGIWTGQRLDMPGIAPAAREQLTSALAKAVAAGSAQRLRTDLGGVPHLVFSQELNPHSRYPRAYEVSVFPLDRFARRRTQVRLEFLAVGGVLLVGAYVASRLAAGRLSAPVEQLAVASERSARFSADASHQLKTPVTVLRAGLEELMAREHLTAEECERIAALIHQTYRLSSLIDDLLLLARMDSGRLRLSLHEVDLAHLIAGALDDLSAMPNPLALQVETQVPPTMFVAGEHNYTAMIVQNLLENARKYNRPGGRIRVDARPEGSEWVVLSIGNTGRPIGPEARAHIFERFHRGAIGENVPGYGLGLNLARELARLHGGELRLVQSENDWTVFELRFRAAGAGEVAS